MEQLTFDFSEPPRKLSGYANRKYKDRPCDDCAAIYTPHSSGQRRCETCQLDRTRAKSREHMRKKARETAAPRYCVDCGTELRRYQGNHSLRCEPCRDVYWTEHTRQRNKERTESGQRKKYDARYREGNRESIREGNRRYKAAHPETDQSAIHRRRMRMSVDMDDTDRLLSRLYRRAIKGDPCFYCDTADAHEVDHFFPLSKGGTDHWWNLISCCRKCNRGVGGKAQACGTAFMLRIGAFATLPAAA